MDTVTNCHNRNITTFRARDTNSDILVSSTAKTIRNRRRTWRICHP